MSVVTLQRIAVALEGIANLLREKQQPTIVVHIDGQLSDPAEMGSMIAKATADYRRRNGQPVVERPEHRACRRPG